MVSYVCTLLHNARFKSTLRETVIQWGNEKHRHIRNLLLQLLKLVINVSLGEPVCVCRRLLRNGVHTVIKREHYTHGHSRFSDDDNGLRIKCGWGKGGPSASLCVDPVVYPITSSYLFVRIFRRALICILLNYITLCSNNVY